MTSRTIENVNSHIFRHVTGFYEKYFHEKIPACIISNVLQHAALFPFSEHIYERGQYHHESSLAFWFKDALPGGDSKWPYTWSPEKRMTTMQLVQSEDMTLPEGESFTRVIGVQTASGVHLYREAFGQMCAMAGAVFANEPLRYFLHAFLVNGNNLEAWVFDPAGAYSCTPIDITSDSERFINIVSTYKYLNEDQLGASTFVGRLTTRYTVFQNRSGENPLYLSLPPITSPDKEGIVDSGPSVYYASSTPLTKGEFVVKFKWRKDFEPSEGLLLEKLRQKQIYGVLQLHHQEEIQTTSKMREGLHFERALELVTGDSLSQQDVHSISNMDLCFAETKPKQNQTGYINRCLSCIAVYPQGLELESYTTAAQAINAFRDALHGHRALYQKARLLHRDVSIFNIMLTDRSSSSNNSQAPHGFLIDIDGAIDLENPPQRNQIIGTKPFMAIELLRGKLPHTYRHDLESFLYCLVWFCISPRSTTIRPPSGSLLRRWRESDNETLAQIKLRDMEHERFKEFLDEFHPDFRHCRGLAEGLRQLLFPVQADGTLCLDTDQSVDGTNMLYDGMIDLFEQCIQGDPSSHVFAHA